MSRDYTKDLTEIRSIMEKSTKVISLSGLSGILAGIYALIGAYFAYNIAYSTEQMVYGEETIRNVRDNAIELVSIAIGVLLLTLITGVILAKKNAKKKELQFWDTTAKKLLINLCIPLFTGAAFIYVLYSNGIIGLIAPATLIFYGLALVNASQHTYRDVRYLGLSEIALGIITCFVIGQGIIMWAIGFGVLHIIYGALMYFKYEK